MSSEAEREEESGAEDVRQMEISVPEMDCPSCVGKVESSLDSVEGIRDRDPRPATGKLKLSYDPGSTTPDDAVEAVEAAGYEVASVSEGSGVEMSSRPDIWWSSRAKKTWLSGILLLAALVGEFVVGLEAVVVDSFVVLGVTDLLLLGAVGVSGGVVLRNGYYSLRSLSLDIDLLMSLAVVGATGIGLFVEAASLAFLFNVAEILEEYSMEKARDSLRRLVSLSPEKARLRRDGEIVEVEVEEVEVGDTVVVRPGEKIPVDGKVVKGTSAVNQSAVTGESVPVGKEVGDEVFAGTVNEEGYLEVDAESDSTHSTLSRIIKLVEDAESEKTQREKFVDRFSKYYTPGVVGLAVAVFVVPTAAGMNPKTWFVRSLTLLVISCPCAIVISTPVTVVSGITSAARNGVLIKGGRYLEAVSESEVVAFDKTGTLTRGELEVTDVVPLGDRQSDDVLSCAAAVEGRSQHPIGVAVAESVEVHRKVTGFESLTGEGVRAEIDGVTHYVGKPEIFDGVGAEGLEDAIDAVDSLSDEGKTAVVVGTSEEIEGVIGVADELRPEARRTVEGLRSFGVEKVVMLTGDNPKTARAVADETGIDSYHAGLLPDDKIELLEDLREEYGDVVMVGDGVNDAPALAAADVGVAMGAAGTDTAIETADVALMGDDISKLPYLYRLSSKSNSVIRGNIGGSLGIKFLLAAGAVLGYVNVIAAVLVGDMGMTLGVTGNAMRLSRIGSESEDSG
ncbi:MAG: cation-translocating P-type ATPase [Halobacteria archaeon]|nr:cation-translocating P-type ATPase [Halobacteria archaeon]